MMCEHQSWVKDAVARFEGPLTLYASRLLRDAETARDVVQDTFLKLCASDLHRSTDTWPSGCSRSAATGRLMSCGRRIG